jgi:hypothetical protein
VRGLAALALFCAAHAGATPDFATQRRVGSVDVYWDDSDPARFYFAPGELAIAQDGDGRPRLQLMQLRYSGSADSGGDVAPMFASTLTLGVELRGPDPQELDLARRFLRKLAGRSSIELRPLPIRALDASLTFAPVEEAGTLGDASSLPSGHFEETAPESGGRYWRERTYNIPLDDRSSQLLWTALERGLVAFSVSYAFIAEGVVAQPPPQLQVSGDGDAASIQEHFAGVMDQHAGEPVLETRTVRAGAVELRVDTARWPDALQRVDLDDRTPPGWALLRLYCFDFKDSLRRDLFSKKVEIEAQAVNDRQVAVEVKFLRSRPDLFARSVRFPVAVRLDRPFRYRVIEARPDGSETAGEWTARDSWAQILDVTSYAPAPPPEGVTP